MSHFAARPPSDIPRREVPVPTDPDNAPNPAEIPPLTQPDIWPAPSEVPPPEDEPEDPFDEGNFPV